MFDRKFIDLIEVFQYVHINTANMKAGTKRRESVIKRLSHMYTTVTRNALFDTYKGDTITELMNNSSYRKFITYYERWYINYKN